MENLSLLMQIKELSNFELVGNQEIPKRFLGEAKSTEDRVLIPCSHELHPPATDEQIANLSQTLGHKLPVQIVDFLRESNGAELFIPSSEDLPYSIPRYKLLNVRELAQTSNEIKDTFLAYSEFDSGTKEIVDLRVNYLAFCDVHDGNFLAISLDKETEGEVFFLDHDFGFYPYGVKETESAYFRIAGSLNDWFEILIDTYGWGGTGGRFIPL